MIPKSLFAMWTAMAPALGNHLWQSTLFAILAGLLTLSLRKNQARVRYWLWLAASVKFLIPVSLLAGIASQLAWSHGGAGTKAGLYMEEIGQPFSQPTMSMIFPATPSTVFETLIHVLPALLVVWLCGFVAVLFVWCVRWRRISGVIRGAAPLQEGREVVTLRRLERIGGIRKGMEMRLSQASLEPGIFGIARPVLVWPQGISERLGDAHLEAILAHEVWHVRRRDNLAAAVHMMVEAIFWFHPLVWWMGARLVEERERACDEEVLEAGSERQVYAESILKICEFCVGSPLTCVSGVTGADLKKRIARIMSEGAARKLDFSRKLLLSAAGLVAIVVPVVFGLLHATQGRAASRAQNTPAIAALRAESAASQAFDVATVKLNDSVTQDSSMNVPLGPEDVYTGGLFSGTNVRLISYIYFAYNLTGNQFQVLMPQLPKWVITDHFDIQARAEGNPNKAQMRLMMQSLLADRFKLAVHFETRQLPSTASALAISSATNRARLSCSSTYD
jgi:bla regulator protein BlaR1